MKSPGFPGAFFVSDLSPAHPSPLLRVTSHRDHRVLKVLELLNEKRLGVTRTRIAQKPKGQPSKAKAKQAYP